jgi:hypothetical protein
MPRRPARPKAWAGCWRCKVPLTPFASHEAANAWVWKHGNTEKHRSTLPADTRSFGGQEAQGRALAA